MPLNLSLGVTGSCVPAYASTVAAVVQVGSGTPWLVGAQKVVKDFAEGMRRIEEYAFPLEDQRVAQYGIHSGVNKVLIVNKEISPGRITLIIVKEKLGF